MDYAKFRRIGGVLCFIDGWICLVGGPLCLIAAIIVWIVGAINKTPGTATIVIWLFGSGAAGFLSGFVILGIADLLYNYDNGQAPARSQPYTGLAKTAQEETAAINDQAAKAYHYQFTAENYRSRGFSDEMMLDDLYSRYENGDVDESEVMGVADYLGYEINPAELAQRKKAAKKGTN